MIIERRSAFTGKMNSVDLDITPEQYMSWIRAGDNDPNRFVQNAFPNLTDIEREFLLTGVTQEEWDNVFGDDED